MPRYKRQSFCGPAGDGPISKVLSFFIAHILAWMDLDFEEDCQEHDVDWDMENGGPNTVDDIEFALRVYKTSKKKYPHLAGFITMIAFVMVRVTALVYKTIIWINKRRGGM